ncbi:MAG: glycoside hydrolase family 5 protein [Luteolibacter sp.]
MIRLIFLLSALTAFAAADDSIQQAEMGRIWLRVPAGSAPLVDVRVSSGSARAAHWAQGATDHEQVTDVNFPIRWWSWKEITIRFTPTQDEMVNFVLSGAWSDGKDGKPFRKEVLWDEVRASGTEIKNGGFETRSGDGPDSWKSQQAPYPAAGDWPLAGAEAAEGKSVAATWHDRPLSQTIAVKAGQPVTLTLQAKAATLPGFVSPKLLGKDTPAHKAAASLKRGMNLGNCWEAPPPYSWGIRFTTEDIDRIAAEGFDHIRVPVAWHFYLKQTGAGLEIDPALLSDLEPVLRRALEKKMHVLLDWHHFNDLTSDPAANRERFVKVWETIARHFQSWPPELFFELLNEPRDALTTEVLNPIQADAIAAIRRICPERIIILSPGNWGDIRELGKLRLPDGDDRLIVTVHCYEPFYFTHQRAGWVQLRDLKGLTFPGPPQTPLEIPASFQDNVGVKDFITGYNTLPTEQNPCSPAAIIELLDLAREWSDHFGRPVHLGEFGSINSIEPVSRARYTREVRVQAEARGIPWTLWDWKATFGYWNTLKNETVLKDALFGN